MRWRHRCRRKCSGMKERVLVPYPQENNEAVLISLEELLIWKMRDYDGKTTEEISNMLGISRVTVSRVLNSVRKKVIKAILDGRPIHIC